MKLKNRFKDEDKIRYWVDHPYCVICKSNQGCALHHIDSTVSASIYNSVMLCDRHHREADTHNTDSPLSREYRAKLRNISYEIIEKVGRIRTKEDEDYLSKYKTS